MSTTQQLGELLESDADEVLRQSRSFDAATRLRLIRATPQRYSGSSEPSVRVKAVWALQALLASTQDRHLPSSTSFAIATFLAAIATSAREPREARRGALDSLALVFLKSREMTIPLDFVIRSAFTSALKYRDAYMSEFASEALSGEGVLARRSTGRVPGGVKRLHISIEQMLASVAYSVRHTKGALKTLARKPGRRKVARSASRRGSEKRAE
jgi:hypothetical protein